MQKFSAKLTLLMGLALALNFSNITAAQHINPNPVLTSAAENSLATPAVYPFVFQGNTIEITMPVTLSETLHNYFSANIAKALYSHLPYSADEHGYVYSSYLKPGYSVAEIKNIAKVSDFYHTRTNKKAELRHEYSNKYSLTANYDVKTDNEKYTSILQSIYTYTGGAHGNTIRYSMTIDKATDEPVALKDLFTVAHYADYLNKLAASQNQDIHFYHPVTLSGNEDFYLTDDGIVLYYQLYEVAPYAAGFIEYKFSYDELTPILK